MDVEGVFSLSNSLANKKELDFEQIYYYLPPKFSKDLESSVVFSAMFTLDGYYEIKKIPLRIGYQHNNLIREMIKNSRWHGGSKDDLPTLFGLFINNDQFCMGSYDGGDYFKRKDIKELWESKGKLKEFHKVDNSNIGFHFGYNYFKDKFDKIKIDTQKGVFYGIVNIESYLVKNNISK